ncbi:hypothetical protein FE257_002538 [Aspergillus nanangensis]|uniref:DUF7514 domain-containing protein n=1 Tax=Aspergillus nanangensis TaxID=2582783 RepID=A0AAD4CTD1_ASPNN|nr:hypothetical protein FE257_002538 [Aspergillus nanangensis]
MAYDDHQSSSKPYLYMGNPEHINSEDYRPLSSTPPYPSQYGPDRIHMPQPPSAPLPTSSPLSQYPEPPRDQSSWQPQPQPQPSDGRINEAVSSAFAGANPQTYLSPDVLSQITATVIQQLKETGLENLQGDQRSSSQPPRPPKQWDPAATLPSDPLAPPPMGTHNVFPPPPNVVYENPEYPPPPPSSTGYSASPHIYSRASPAPPSERRESPASQASDYSQKVETRPRAPPRDATVTELTTLEKVWGKLFEGGKPTDRLGQFLRGIAVHLIEDYPPGNTLVIIPEKMQKFYQDTKVESDPYPWQDIFDDRTSSISRLFREAEIEHHLVQNKLDERPDIPGLTPRGFEKWATLMIQAHPEREYERLQTAVLNMPISNPDNKKERFPKEIPRRLFPEVPELRLREDLDQSIMRHCGVDLPPITDEDIKKVAVHRHKVSKGSTASAASVPSFSDRERKPHRASTSAVVDDDDSDKEIPSHPIERQRKPYSAQPGGGKVYEDDRTIHRRANSSSASSIPKDIPLPSSVPRMSDSYSPDPLYRSGTGSSQRAPKPFGRSRSPSRGGANHRHSESDLLGHNVAPRYGGAPPSDYHYTPGATNITGDLDDGRRYKDLDRDLEDQRLFESLREREREREKSKYHDHIPNRSSWSGEEDYHRGMLGGQGGGPVGGGYDKPYGYN